jgi:DMSO/TMAO reductase YedYZ molybdopterin-dependent catalytic subunit
MDLGEHPDIAVEAWKLEVGGLVENPLTLTWAPFLLLPQAEDVSDFHCVTDWSRYDNHWGGVRFRTVAELAVPKVQAKFVLCTGYDFMPGTETPFTVNVPLARAVDEDVLLVHGDHRAGARQPERRAINPPAQPRSSTRSIGSYER